MAVTINQTRVNGMSILNAKLIDGAGVAGNGEWIDIRGLKNYTITVTGITIADVTISGSNADTRPANSSHLETLGSVIQADDSANFTVPFKWIKARVSDWTSGTITVIIEGQFQ